MSPINIQMNKTITEARPKGLVWGGLRADRTHYIPSNYSIYLISHNRCNISQIDRFYSTSLFYIILQELIKKCLDGSLFKINLELEEHYVTFKQSNQIASLRVGNSVRLPIGARRNTSRASPPCGEQQW